MLFAKTSSPVEVPAAGGVRPLPPGAVKWKLETGPGVDGKQVSRWLAVDADGLEVLPAPPPGPPLFPWGAIRHRMRLVVRPVYVAGGVVGVAALVDSAHVPAAGVAAGAVAATALVWRVAPVLLVRDGMVADGAPKRRWPRLGDLKRKAADLVARRRRLAAYLTATAGAWITFADVAGLDPHTLGGCLSWTVLGPLAAVAARPYVKYVQPRPEIKSAAEPEAPADVLLEPDFGQIIAARWADTVGAVARPERKVKTGDPAEPEQIIPAVVGGKLPGTVLTGIHRVAGGWAATAVDPLQRGHAWTGESSNGQQVGPRRQIAATFGAGLSAVTLEPDGDDATRCYVMVQKQSPLKNIIHWDGPDSVDGERGTGMFGRYADGNTAQYEVYRPGWGCPHDALFGTTGSGKSEAFQILMLIDRWMHYLDPQGRPVGMVADFLIDPQHGQSFGPFVDDLAAPVAATLEEATMMVEAFTREMLRRNEYLATVEWVDSKGRRRKGRKWWNPLVDGPILVLNIDEAHYFLAVKAFANLLTAGARMWRKCGGKVRLATHTPLLTDLGGSTALRDMLTGGFVWVGRIANSLSSGPAFNGQLPVDPRSIPKVPGTAYALAGENPRAMLLRTAWEEDFYDYVRDDAGQPIGYPAALPQVTLDAFGKAFCQWRNGGLLVPSSTAKAVAAEEQQSDQRAEDAVLEVLLDATGPLDNKALDQALEPYRQQGVKCAVRTMGAALKKLKEAGMLEPTHGRHQLTAAAREQLLADRAELVGADA